MEQRLELLEELVVKTSKETCNNNNQMEAIFTYMRDYIDYNEKRHAHNVAVLNRRYRYDCIAVGICVGLGCLYFNYKNKNRLNEDTKEN